MINLYRNYHQGQSTQIYLMGLNAGLTTAWSYIVPDYDVNLSSSNTIVVSDGSCMVALDEGDKVEILKTRKLN